MLCLSHCFNKGQFCVYRTALYTLLSGLTLSKFTFSHLESSLQFICDWFWVLIVSLGGVFGSHSSWQFSNIFLTPSRSCLDAGLLVCSPFLPDAAALWQSGQCTLRPFFRVSVRMSGGGAAVWGRGGTVSVRGVPWTNARSPLPVTLHHRSHRWLSDSSQPLPLSCHHPRSSSVWGPGACPAQGENCF